MNVLLIKMTSESVKVEIKELPYISFCFNENENFMSVTSNNLPYLMSYDYSEFIGHSNFYIETFYDSEKKLYHGKVHCN